MPKNKLIFTDDRMAVTRGERWVGENEEGKGDQAQGKERRLDFGSLAQNRVYRCRIKSCTPKIYIMLLTSVTQYIYE